MRARLIGFAAALVVVAALPQTALAKPKLSAADRKAIDALLDKYLPAGMERKNMKLAWQLSGPEMKSGSTLFQWTTLKNTPIPYYVSREQTIADWQVIAVERNAVVLNFLLHPAKGQPFVPYAFSTQVVKHGSKWLVNRMYVIATFQPVRHKKHELGPADFAAPPPTAGTDGDKGTHHLPSYVVFVVASAVAAIILVPLLAFGGVALLRAARWRRERRRLGTEMPPLPQSRISQH